MENKVLNFYVYRYHLLPIATQNQQYRLFEDKRYTLQEIKERKNEFFENTLNNLLNSKNNNNPLKLEFNENEYYIFKIAQRKTTTITKNFENIQIGNEPYVYVIFNNNPNIQKIAISDNKDAFSNPDVVKNILKKVFRNDLEKFGLNIEIETLFDKVDFWKYVNKHKNEITFINFEYIKPNLANISKSLPIVFKDFTNSTNSHESHITIKAPDKGVLDNIDKKNQDINGLVNYISEGAGNIKLKVKSIRKQLNTKEKPIIMQINEIDIEGQSDQVIKLYKSIVE